ncbi:hypothetical protein [Paenimyroides viscosum]|jgi:vacuolar-type H+-ATPase subunit I/STV1|uniref:Uncharacterized protein n=1 Tax=Paenimyroides viscosum TaxID=2488729 RepID=A0A3P1AT33_9FLAO|nr:hypothetical protein [Paenimyroides viscosum]RRA91102.1 hypothetical protein EG242_13095 [Paenimyroides viscosum]
MKYILMILLLVTVTISCKKEVITTPNVTTKISQDSMVKTIHEKWKFTVVVNNPTISSKLNNWEDWRNYVNELTITPSASKANLIRRANALVEKTAVLKSNIPELYNKPETKARLTLLETHVQNLDMQLELVPLNSKEIILLLANIQKSTNSLINQFNEFEVKLKIPKEVGEDKLIQPIDTIKRATLNALPTE